MRAAVVALVLLPLHVAAQPTGDDVIDRYGLAAIRPLASEIAKLQTTEPLDDTRYAAVVQLRARYPILGRLGALDDPDLGRVAGALCHGDAACETSTARALRCLADRCEVALPEAPRVVDEIKPNAECRVDRRRKKAPLLGAGFDWGNGLQRSRAANDGRATSIGIAARLRLSERYGLVARADRTDGRDEATDLDGNGVDDFRTSSITRFTALGGPSIVLDSTRYDNTTRSIRLDLLAGYMATKTLPGEDGLAVGADLALQISIFRTGVRLVQGLGDASHETNLVIHFGLTVGATPTKSEIDDCPPGRRSSPLALGFEVPLLGGGFSSQLGYMAIGFGAELVWHLHRKLDALVHADLLAFPRRERDRVIQQAALVGFRVDHGPKARRKRSGWFSTLMAGVAQGADLEPSTVGDGPIADASVAWGGQDDETAGYVRLHARFGLAPSNVDFRAVFLSVGFEMRFDRQQWADRDRTW